MELSFDPITLELHLSQVTLFENMCELVSPGVLLIIQINTSGMMQMKIIKPLKWNWNCKEKLDHTSRQGFSSPVDRKAVFHSISLLWS